MQTNELYQLAAVAFCLLSAWVSLLNSIISFMHTGGLISSLIPFGVLGNLSKNFRKLAF